MRDRKVRINELVEQLTPMVSDDIWSIANSKLTKEEHVRLLGETVVETVVDRRLPLDAVVLFAELGVLLYQEKEVK